MASARGMAAVFGALACQLKAGDHLVSSRALFGSCYQIVTNILPRFGMTATLVDGNDMGRWRDAITPGTKCVFLETPSNPDARGDRHRGGRAPSPMRRGACVVVDNIFATPILQKPLDLRRRCRRLFRHQAY